MDKTIPMTPVASSNIAAVGYQNGTLAVQFTNGRLYHYSDVPPEVYAEMLAASSVGKYFASNVRGKYPAEQQGRQQ
ncbi:MAG: KTSC domain-containing protein [Pseudomonadota bacterium]